MNTKPKFLVETCVMGMWTVDTVESKASNAHEKAKAWSEKGVIARVVKLTETLVKEYVPLGRKL